VRENTVVKKGEERGGIGPIFAKLLRKAEIKKREKKNSFMAKKSAVTGGTRLTTEGRV